MSKNLTDFLWALVLVAPFVVACLVFLVIHSRPTPYRDRPTREEGYEAYLKWQAHNPNLGPAIRYCASKVLADIYAERAADARTRAIIREELQRNSTTHEAETV